MNLGPFPQHLRHFRGGTCAAKSESSEGLTIEKLVAIKRMFERPPVEPRKPLYYWATWRQLRDMGWTPLMISGLLKCGRLVREGPQLFLGTA